MEGETCQVDIVCIIPYLYDCNVCRRNVYHLKIKQRDEEVKIEIMWQSYIDTSPKDIN